MEATNLNDNPVLQRMDRFYSVIDGVLHIYKHDMTVLKTIPIPLDEKVPTWREVVDAHWTSSSGKSSDHVPMGPWHLVDDLFHDRLLANNMNVPALVFACNNEGTVEWLTLLGSECCNFPCIILRHDRILHASSCGRRVSALSSEGIIIRQHQLPKEYWGGIKFVGDGKDGAVLFTLDRVLFFDADANLTKEVEKEMKERF